MEAYEEAIRYTSTDWAPWHVIPADHKWFTRVAVADILLKTLKIPQSEVSHSLEGTKGRTLNNKGATGKGTSVKRLKNDNRELSGDALHDRPFGVMIC